MADGPTAARRRWRVLVADDQDDTRRILEHVLLNLGYDTELARDGLEALAKLQLNVDLVLLDAEMPGMDGFTVAQRIRQDHRTSDLPIIMVTGLDAKEDRLRAVKAGVNDFVNKPFDIQELEVRCASLLRLKEAIDLIKRHGTELEETVRQRTGALRQALEDMAAAQRGTYHAHLDTIRRLVIAAEYKDHDTAAHIERIGRYAEVIARSLELPPGQVEVIRHAAPMHDVGKIGIPDAILLKPGKLSDEEWVTMKQHTVMGARILHGSPSGLLQVGEEIALSHHEKWDGSGYPNGIAGDAIPLSGRICAVADVFDALASSRRYRSALSNAAVFDRLEAERGHHFDPVIVDAFLRHREAVERVQHDATRR